MKNNIYLLSSKDMKKSILAGLLTSVSVVLGIMPFFYFVRILDMLAQNQSIDSIISKCIIIAILLIGKSVFHGLGIAVSHRVAFSTLADIRSRIISYMERLSLADIEKQKSGIFAQIVNHEVEQVELFLAHAVPELLVLSIVPLSILVFMYTIFWQFAIILTLQIPLLVLYMIWFTKRYSPRFNELTKKTNQMSSDLLEYIEGIRVIKAFNTGKGRTRQIIKRMNDYISWVRKVAESITLPKFVQNLIISGGAFFVAVIGINYLVDGIIEYKTFVIGIIFSNYFGESLGKLLGYTFKVMKFNASKKAILSVLSIPLRKKGIRDDITPGDIEFKSVSFAYDDESVIEDISFKALYNTTTALVGTSGSGKTTLGKLVNGFLLPDNGSVSINGVPTNKISEDAIAQLVSYVQQDAFIFNTTIYENILIGNPEASEREVHRAAKKARIHDFIESLNDGYNTQVGAAGTRLSGGEKQRISLARMILKNAPIIVLDEATAAIDTKNEKAIQRAIEAVSYGKTKIVITHRMDTIQSADNIILLEDGHIFDQGTHQDLLSRCELYREMVNASNAVDRWTIKEE